MAAMNSTSGWRTLSQTQCVILAGHPGSRMFPVTLDKPKALLPVANIPILTQLLTTLERLNFASAIVVTSEEFQEQITAFRDYYRGPVQVDPVVYPDSTGTADVIRNLHAEGRLASDGILVLPGELLVEEQLAGLMDMHLARSSDVTMLLVPESVPEDDATGGGGAKKVPVKKVKRDEEDVEYIGLVEDDRVVLKTPALAIEEGQSMPIPKTILTRSGRAGHGERLRLRTNLNDMHVYALSSWAIRAIAAATSLSSLKSDAVPYFVRRNFRGHKDGDPGGQLLPEGIEPRDRSDEQVHPRTLAPTFAPSLSASLLFLLRPAAPGPFAALASSPSFHAHSHCFLPAFTSALVGCFRLWRKWDPACGNANGTARRPRSSSSVAVSPTLLRAPPRGAMRCGRTLPANIFL